MISTFVTDPYGVPGDKIRSILDWVNSVSDDMFFQEPSFLCILIKLYQTFTLAPKYYLRSLQTMIFQFVYWNGLNSSQITLALWEQ